MRVRIAAPMVAALFASQSLMALPALASHVTRETVVIAAGDGGQYDPAIKGDWIAFTDTSTGDADIVVKSISTGTTVRIGGSTGSGAQEVEDIDGNYVVFRHWTTGVPSAEIFVYNLATGVYTQITDDDLHQTDPAISGTRIVWTQFDSDGFSAIFTANIDGTGKQAIAPAAGVIQIDPAISGNTVVWWEAAPGADGSIVAVDITIPAVPVKTTIATGADRWPDVHGMKIVYAVGGNVYLRDGATTTQLTDDATTQRRPKVSDTLVAWESLVASGNIDVEAWDSRTGGIEPLASGAGLQELHDLDGTNLAYTERSVDPAGDIYLVRELASPAALALSPPAGVNDVGTTHTVTATVTDAGGQPVGEVVVRFTVTGSVSTSGSCPTNTNGQCDFAYSGPSLPGADAISAYADTDGDAVLDVGEPVGEATKAWILPSSTAGQASGGGNIADADGNKIAFGFSAKNENNGLQGHCNVVDPRNDRMIKCLDVTSFVISGNEATIHGNATDNGAATTYILKVKDVAEPGKGADTFSIQTTSGYSTSGTLTGGNVQVE